MSLNRDVLTLAWPVMIAMALTTILSLIDAFWLGRLGTDALAAIAPAQFASWLLWTLGAIIETGLPALVAQAVGAADWQRARRGAATAAQTALVLGVLLAAAADPFARFLFGFVGVEPHLAAAGTAYLRILFWGSALLFVFLSLEGALRATGDARTPMWFSASMVLSNMVLDPLFIFGWGPFPAGGVAGAAWATVTSQLLAVTAFLVYQSRRADPILTMSALKRVDVTSTIRLLSVGIPGGATAGLFTVVYIVLAIVVGRMGETPLAVLGVGNRLESINYLIASGFTVSASTLVGNAVGRADVARAAAAAWRSTAFAALFTGAVGLAFFVWPRVIFGWFSSDPLVIEEGARFLRILALCQMWTGMESAVFGAFAGAGRTLPAMVITGARRSRASRWPSWRF